MSQQLYISDIKTEKDHTTTPDKKYESLPLDLSRRCDSVDTIKTYSPYSASAGSPLQDNSPNKPHHSNLYSDRSPPHNSSFVPAISDYRMAYPCQKRNTPSPDQSFYGRSYHNPVCNSIAPYMMQAAVLQQRLSQPTPPADDEAQETVSNKNAVNPYPFQMVVGRDGKLSRPFKAYPRDPLTMASFSITNGQSAEKFELFRMKMLKHIHDANGGQATISNPKMRRTSSRAEVSVAETETETLASNNNSDSSSNSGVKDVAYYERRKKNNAAAKKSRDRRRIKEDEIAIRATFLENENREVQADLLSAKNLIAELKVENLNLRKRLSLLSA